MLCVVIQSIHIPNKTKCCVIKNTFYLAKTLDYFSINHDIISIIRITKSKIVCTNSLKILRKKKHNSLWLLVIIFSVFCLCFSCIMFMILYILRLRFSLYYIFCFLYYVYDYLWLCFYHRQIMCWFAKLQPNAV